MKINITRLRARLWCVQKRLVVCSALAGTAALVGGPVLAQTQAAFIVQSDRGGMLGQRSREIRKLRAAGQRVELRGTCLSACTMYLSLPNVCVSSSATFGFHGPTRDGQRLSDPEFDHWSQVMANNYREPLRSWFLTEARYRTSGFYKLSGAELIRIGYPQC